VLTTGRVLYHYHGGTMSRRSKGLEEICPEAKVELNPLDARTLNVGDGDLVKVSSRRGTVTAKAEVVDRPAQGVVFMTFHFHEAAANLLTIAALDPVAKIPEYKACAVKVERVG
jgi:predicted molibdopterin-dependent oxidoreductase YjgC